MCETHGTFLRKGNGVEKKKVIEDLFDGPGILNVMEF